MKLFFSGILIWLTINSIYPQGDSTISAVNPGNYITFKHNGFILNNSLFFPIGWYDDVRSQLDYTSHFERIVATGANLVLPYYQFLMDTNKSPSDYYKILKKYLDAASKAHLLVVVQLPSRFYRSDFFPDKGVTEQEGNDFVDYLVPRLKDHPALFGWYLVDEPEAPPQKNGWTTAILRKRYLRIKGIDARHPVFICYGLANNSDTGEEVPTLNKGLPSLTSNDIFYDVLMEDRYLIDTNSTSPSPALGLIDNCMKSLAQRYKDDGRNSTSGATIVIVQAYGLGFGEPHRDPTAVEIKYLIFSYLAYAQDPDYCIPGGKAGGIFWWRQGITTPALRGSITDFTRYFITNKIANIIAQPNINNLILNNTNSIKTFLRYYKESYYLFAMNQSDISQAKQDITLNIGAYNDCNEIVVSGNPIQKTLNFIRNGNYILEDTFTPRECKLYKIRNK